MAAAEENEPEDIACWGLQHRAHSIDSQRSLETLTQMSEGELQPRVTPTGENAANNLTNNFRRLNIHLEVPSTLNSRGRRRSPSPPKTTDHDSSSPILTVLKPSPRQERLSKKPFEAVPPNSPVARSPTSNIIESLLRKEDEASTQQDQTPCRKKSRKWKYRKLKPLGRGAFGCVFLAYSETLSKLMAVKRIDAIGGITEEVRNEFANEVHLMQKLNHPNIVRMFDCVAQTNRVEIYMEYIDGNSIDHQLKVHGPFPEFIIKYYTVQMLQALIYCHGMGVIHRDLKGKNILVTSKGMIKLADFGSAKLTDGLLEQKGFEFNDSFKYTPQWVAPEVLTGRWDEKVDVWSLGCVVQEMASARAPWHEMNLKNVYQVMYHIANTEATPAVSQNLSKEGQRFAERCFTRDKKTRPSVRELLTDKWVVEMWQSSIFKEAGNKAMELTSIIKALDKCGMRYQHPPKGGGTQSMHEKKRSQSVQLHLRRSSC